MADYYFYGDLCVSMNSEISGPIGGDCWVRWIRRRGAYFDDISPLWPRWFIGNSQPCLQPFPCSSCGIYHLLAFPSAVPPPPLPKCLNLNSRRRDVWSRASYFGTLWLKEGRRLPGLTWSENLIKNVKCLKRKRRRPPDLVVVVGEK